MESRGDENMESLVEPEEVETAANREDGNRAKMYVDKSETSRSAILGNLQISM